MNDREGVTRANVPTRMRRLSCRRTNLGRFALRLGKIRRRRVVSHRLSLGSQLSPWTAVGRRRAEDGGGSVAAPRRLHPRRTCSEGPSGTSPNSHSRWRPRLWPHVNNLHLACFSRSGQRGQRHHNHPNRVPEALQTAPQIQPPERGNHLRFRCATGSVREVALRWDARSRAGPRLSSACFLGVLGLAWGVHILEAPKASASRSGGNKEGLRSRVWGWGTWWGKRPCTNT